MHYVYILESIATPGHYYIGYTANLRDRIQKHQADVSSHAAKFRPLKLKLYIAFESKDSALAFELYLKSGSGRAFCKRHFAEEKCICRSGQPPENPASSSKNAAIQRNHRSPSSVYSVATAAESFRMKVLSRMTTRTAEDRRGWAFSAETHI